MVVPHGGAGGVRCSLRCGGCVGAGGVRGWQMAAAELRGGPQQAVVPPVALPPRTLAPSVRVVCCWVVQLHMRTIKACLIKHSCRGRVQ